MFQKGPGSGYLAAKEHALQIEPTAVCRLSYDGGIRHYRIHVKGKDIACGATSSREAWNKFLGRLETEQESQDDQ